MSGGQGSKKAPQGALILIWNIRRKTKIGENMWKQGYKYGSNILDVNCLVGFLGPNTLKRATHMISAFCETASAHGRIRATNSFELP